MPEGKVITKPANIGEFMSIKAKTVSVHPVQLSDGTEREVAMEFEVVALFVPNDAEVKICSMICLAATLAAKPASQPATQFGFLANFSP